MPAAVQEKVNARDLARRSKDWAQSDALRTEIEALGYEVGDSPTGTTVKKRLL